MSAPKAAEQVIGLYRRHARAWAAARGAEPGSEAGWLARFAGLLPSGGAVLDIGCGPGAPMAQNLRARGHPVFGVDSSPEMIALFRANLPDAEADVCDMRALDLGRRFDGVIAWDSFFHLTPEDQRGMFAVFRRHSKAGALLMFTSGPAAGEAIGILEGEELYHASLDVDEYQRLLTGNGYALIDHVAEDAGAGGHTVWLARQGPHCL